jgi:hypothetical protein
LRLRFNDLDSIVELYTEDDFRQLVVAAQTIPTFFGGFPAVGGTIANSGTTHGHWTDAGHDLALGQMPMAHQPAVAIIGQLIGMTAEEARNLGLECDALRLNFSDVP